MDPLRSALQHFASLSKSYIFAVVPIPLQGSLSGPSLPAPRFLHPSLESSGPKDVISPRLAALLLSSLLFSSAQPTAVFASPAPVNIFSSLALNSSLISLNIHTFLVYMSSPFHGSLLLLHTSHLHSCSLLEALYHRPSSLQRA